MPTLMGLPSEILISIIDVTEPEDAESFSICCKLIYSLAGNRIKEHEQKKSLFSTLFVGNDFLPRPWSDANYDSSNTQLREFFSDERNLFYPTTMVARLPPCGNNFRNESEDGGTAGTLTTDGSDEIGRQLECRVHNMIGLDVGGVDAEEWSKQVGAGDSIAVFLLLLALLPNLEWLSIENLGQSTQTLSTNCLSIMRLMTEGALEQQEKGLGFGGRLSECTVKGYDGTGVEENLLPFFMMLPKMRVIRGYFFGVENGSWPCTDAVSPVVDLTLNGGIDTATLSNCIRGIRELKRFKSYYLCENENWWEPRGIISTLEQFAFRSLVHLDLTTAMPLEMIRFDSTSSIVSLRSFEVLETIRLDCILLFEGFQTADNVEETYVSYSEELWRSLHDDAKIQKLINFLPSSVRVFQLESIAEGELVFPTFEGFMEHRVERLPNFELISLDAGDEFNGQIEKICGEAGVQVTSSKDNSTFSDLGP